MSTASSQANSVSSGFEQQQFGRFCQLLVSDSKGNALDLSAFRIRFGVKKSGVMTPNVADIRVYNLAQYQAQLIQKAYTKVVLTAGYLSNNGVIFSGNIKQIILGRESATDTFVDLIAGDGVEAYNFSIVNQTIQNPTPANQIQALTSSMNAQGVTQGYVGPTPTNQLYRGKVMYGNSRDYMNRLAQTTASVWSIQNEQVVFIPAASYLPGQAVVLSSKTGMVGTPEQTIEGINCKCLLNPGLKVHGRVQINNASVQQFKLNQFVPGSAANTPVPLTNDGFYYIFIAEHSGDTRGVEWYTSLTLLNINPTSNPLNGAPTGVGSVPSRG